MTTIETSVETSADLSKLFEQICQQVPPDMAIKALASTLGFFVADAAKDQKDSASSVILASVMQAISACATTLEVTKTYKITNHIPALPPSELRVADQVLQALQKEYENDSQGMEKALAVLASVTAAGISTVAQNNGYTTVHTVALDFIDVVFNHMRYMHERAAAPESVRGWRALTTTALSKYAQNQASENTAH